VRIKESLEATWRSLLDDQFDLEYLQNLLRFLAEQRALGKEICPRENQTFAALNAVSVDKVKVVVIGQDPYHGSNQAHGLSFSVPYGVAIPSSLRNIFKEISEDLNLTQTPKVESGNLFYLARQGVLLLNSILSVEQSKAASHRGKGWEKFTDVLVRRLSERRQGLIFLLWGRYAQKKGALVDAERHHILTAAHPSPLSSHRGFFGCKHFSKANQLLNAQGLSSIKWLPTQSII
jgi:uracil-DNA glycosylase